MAPKKSAAHASSKKTANSKSPKARPSSARATGDGPPAALPKARKAARAAKPAQTPKLSAPASSTRAPKQTKTPKSSPARPNKTGATEPIERATIQVTPANIAPAISALGPTPAKEPVKEPSQRRDGVRPHIDELRVMATDDIWAYYRTAVKQHPRDAAWLEQLRNVLMELHYPLVKHIAERLLQTLPKSIELDDLVSAGLFGLMDAIRGFDPDRGIKFKTYCTTRIRGSILDQLRSQDWVPRLVRLKAGRIEKMLQKLQGEYGREPTHAELAQALQMDHTELSAEMSQSHAKTMFSLSERWDDRDDDNPMEKVEIVEDQKAIDPIGELNRRDLMLYITKSLTHKERFIIEQYYQVGHTMREIGEMLALTESRVCQIHSNVMSRLKGLLSPKSNNLIT